MTEEKKNGRGKSVKLSFFFSIKDIQYFILIENKICIFLLPCGFDYEYGSYKLSTTDSTISARRKRL